MGGHHEYSAAGGQELQVQDIQFLALKTSYHEMMAFSLFLYFFSLLILLILCAEFYYQTCHKLSHDSN